MSYLNDDPLTPEEEKAIRHAERQYNYIQQPMPDRKLRNLPVPITRHKNVPDYDVTDFLSLRSDYIKYSLPKGADSIQLNITTYRHLVGLIKRHWGRFPHSGFMICDSITIMPKPNSRCSLYYRPGENEAGQPGKYYLIQSFVSDSYTRKLSVSCPYSDSLIGGCWCIFNWFGNDKTGRIVPKANVSKQFYLDSPNDHMPWLQPVSYGSFYITGIQDAVGFHCSFIDKGVHMVHARQRPAKNKPKTITEHVPKVKYLSPGNDIGYEIPSHDITYNPNDPDPLIEYLDE